MHPSTFINYKILIIDFNDSFTFNIVSELFKITKNIEVINYDDFSLEKLKNFELEFQRIGIVLGPGPGHPSEYEKIFPIIEYLFSKKSLYYLFGICLGHQMIASFLGYNISDSCDKVHGESVAINFQNRTLHVQRYNSLAVNALNYSNELFNLKNEVWIMQDSNYFSVQFHPESIGTDNSNDFFSLFINHLGK